MLETGEKNNEESMSAQLYTITQRDGSIWGIPGAVLNQLWAAYKKEKYKGDFSRFAADFDSDACSFEEAAEAVAQSGDWSPIWEWATKDLKWADVAGHAVEVKGPDPLSVSDFEDAWGNGIWDVSSTGGDAA
jgi:hypothetical protein